MSVLIKGMEVPTRCEKCQFFIWKRVVGQYCAVASDITFHVTIDGMDVVYERNGNCPLIEVPEPHGRIIDTGSWTFPTLYRNPSNDYMYGWNACLKSVHQQPTIIPASGDGET